MGAPLTWRRPQQIGERAPLESLSFRDDAEFLGIGLFSSLCLVAAFLGSCTIPAHLSLSVSLHVCSNHPGVCSAMSLFIVSSRWGRGPPLEALQGL